MEKRNNTILKALLLCTTLSFGIFFTSVRANTVGSESLEAGYQIEAVASIESFEDLVQK